MRLTIDGIGYKLWSPENESDLEKMLKEHYKVVPRAFPRRGHLGC